MGYAERPGPASDRMFRLCARYLALPIGLLSFIGHAVGGISRWEVRSDTEHTWSPAARRVIRCNNERTVVVPGPGERCPG